jgi:hypothetical protein
MRCPPHQDAPAVVDIGAVEGHGSANEKGRRGVQDRVADAAADCAEAGDPAAHTAATASALIVVERVNQGSRLVV